MSLDDLRSDFQIVKGQFAEAATIEEKLRLVAISQRIITAAHAEIDVFKSGLAARMILVGTLMTATSCLEYFLFDGSKYLAYDNANNSFPVRSR